MRKLTVFLLMTSCCFCNMAAQTLKGGDIEVVKNEALNYDFKFNLYFDSENDITKEYLLVSFSGVIDTANIISQTEPVSGIKKLVFTSNHTFPGVPAEYLIRVLDTFPLPDLVNVENDIFLFTYFDLVNVGGPLYGNNALPTFEHDLSEGVFENGQWVFNTGAIDNIDGDSLFYFFIDYTSLNTAFFNPIYPDYTFPISTDSFAIDNLTGEVSWNRPTEIGNYLIGMTAMEFSHSGFFLSKQDRFWIIEVTEEDLITSVASRTKSFVEQIVVSPNPVTDVLHLRNLNNQLHSKNVDIIIFNSIGEIIYSENNVHLKKTINVNKVPSGIYWIQFSLANDEKIIKPFIIQK